MGGYCGCIGHGRRLGGVGEVSRVCQQRGVGVGGKWEGRKNLRSVMEGA